MQVRILSPQKVADELLRLAVDLETEQKNWNSHLCIHAAGIIRELIDDMDDAYQKVSDLKVIVDTRETEIAALAQELYETNEALHTLADEVMRELS